MSYITDVTIIGLDGQAGEFLHAQVEAYWDEMYGDDPTTFPPENYQRLVDVSPHAGGRKVMTSVLAAAFNYGPSLDDWQAWIDEVVEQFKPYRLYAFLDLEVSEDVRVYAHGKWIPAYQTPCERELERCKDALQRIAQLDHQTASVAPIIAREIVAKVTA